MKQIKYKIVLIVILITSQITAQHFEKKFTKEIKTTSKKVSLNADYADVEIKEWHKDTIKIDAVMVVDGVSEEVAQNYFDTWKIDIKKDGKKIRITSKSKNHFPMQFNSITDLDTIHLEMPEISIESLGVLDSMNFSFPEINFSEVFNDSIYTKIFTHDFSVELDSLTNKIQNFDYKKLKENQRYLQEWQEANKENFIKLREKVLELAMQNREKHYQYRKDMAKKRAKIALKRAKVFRKRAALKEKIAEKRQRKIKEILKNRKATKVRTKLKIYVPKGTSFNMNVNYSTISMD